MELTNLLALQDRHPYSSEDEVFRKSKWSCDNAYLNTNQNNGRRMFDTRYYDKTNNNTDDNDVLWLS